MSNDVVCRASNQAKIGIVVQSALDSEDDSDSENEEQISEGHVLVAWYPKGQEEEISEKQVLKCLCHLSWLINETLKRC